MSWNKKEAEDAESVVSAEALAEAEKKLSEAEALNNELRKNRDALSAELREIKNSKAWRLITVYRRIRFKILAMFNRAGTFFELTGVAFRMLRSDGPRYLWHKVRQRIGSGGGSVPGVSLQDVYANTVPMACVEDEISPLACHVSVFIPTCNAGPEFDELLDRLNRQKGLGGIDILVVDSGSRDGTPERASHHNARLIRIDPASFNHGETRNIGIEETEGEFILYITQDAIPIGETFLHRMAGLLVNHTDVAAVTCRQVPRSDSDLFFAFSMDNHYRVLNLLEDKIMGSEHPEKLTPIQKRAIAGLDDVCTLYRKSVLEKYRFNRLSFAEDLDLGLRLVEDGHKLAFLASCAVIHSHNRPPIYTLKRSYIDTKCLESILSSGGAAIHTTLQTAASDIGLMFQRINHMLENRDPSAPLTDMLDLFDTGKRSDKHRTGDEQFVDFMSRWTSPLSAKPIEAEKKMFFESFRERLKTFLKYLEERLVVIDEYHRDDFNESVYKLFAVTAGNQLAMQHLKNNTKTTPLIDKNQSAVQYLKNSAEGPPLHEEIDVLLTKDV